MRNLALPSRDDVRQHLTDSVYTYRYKKETLGHQITAAEIDAIVQLYDTYDAARGAARDEFKGQGYSESLRSGVKHAYGHTYDGKVLYPIRSILFASTTLCPICGIEEPTELDHHLPESKFELLAIYIRNLVPLCHKCNKKKLAIVGDEAGVRLNFMHAYFDTLPSEQFLRADIEIKENGLIVVFGIADDTSLTEEYVGRLSGQINQLNLNSRYQREVNTYISGHAVTLQSFFEIGGADKVKGWLTANAKQELNQTYRNHWKPTLLEALSMHDDFVNGGFAKILPVPKEIVEDFLRPK